jgi:hypothetical protein
MNERIQIGKKLHMKPSVKFMLFRDSKISSSTLLTMERVWLTLRKNTESNMPLPGKSS